MTRLRSLLNPSLCSKDWRIVFKECVFSMISQLFYILPYVSWLKEDLNITNIYRKQARIWLHSNPSLSHLAIGNKATLAFFYLRQRQAPCLWLSVIVEICWYFGSQLGEQKLLSGVVSFQPFRDERRPETLGGGSDTISTIQAFRKNLI